MRVSQRRSFTRESPSFGVTPMKDVRLNPEMASGNRARKPLHIGLVSDELPGERKASWIHAGCAGFR
jgi:hypothetical protein